MSKNKEERQIGSIWSDWKSYPSEVDDGKYITVKSIRDCINKEYNPTSLYGGSTSISCALLHAILKKLKVEVVKPNGVYNIPSFSAKRKKFVIEWIYDNPKSILMKIEKPEWVTHRKPDWI